MANEPFRKGGEMNATLVFYPTGSDRWEYSLEFELPGVPNVGDYVSVQRTGQNGTEDFVVRGCWWELEHPTNQTGSPPNRQGSVQFLHVKCEAVLGPRSTPGHQDWCRRAADGKEVERFTFDKA
jgi:hypothetical protein